MWDLYKKHPGWVLGFHGCDESIGEQVLSGKVAHLAPSKNEYDWLGEGIYFWENNPARALEFARDGAGSDPKVTKGKIANPFVIGAIIDLGLCFNLLDSSALAELAEAHKTLETLYKSASLSMPVNKGKDRRVRFLDRAVIEAVHDYRALPDLDGNPVLPRYDSVRAGFWEGDELFVGAGFAEKSHIQIAVCNTDCIKGYFRPIRSPM